MRILTLLLILVTNVLLVTAHADDEIQVVKVADPFIEMHTGPSVGYPIINVIQRDETISIIKRRTSWFLIQDRQEKEGWVHRSQLVKTLTLDNEKVEVKDITRENYLDHDWEVSMIGGEFDELPISTLSAGYAFTRNLSTELSIGQIIGEFSSRQFINASLIHQPFPNWKVSPYFTVGTGRINTTVKSTLTALKDQSDKMANVGFGIKMYLTRRFVFRADFKKYIIFQSRDKNEELTSWQAGFAFFF